jgi:putative endopeptidase
VNVLFALFSSPDKANSSHSMGALYQSGLGLPDRDYYIDADKAEKRDRYVEYVSKLFGLLGANGVTEYVSETKCQAAARSVLAFETELASAHLTRTDARDPQLTYNKMSIDDLATRAKSHPISWKQYLSGGLPKPFDWGRYFAAIGKDAAAMGDINVATLDAITVLATLLQSPYLQHYLAFHVANSNATNLGAAFEELHFDFFDRFLKGTSVQQPRWKVALNKLEAALGDELGKLYVAKYFSGDAKPKALHIVETVRAALRQRLEEVEWMSETTRKAALVKMEKFKVKIGFPDKWLDYSEMTVVAGDHFSNVLEARRYAHRLEVSICG